MSTSTASDADITGALAARVREATARRTPLRIVGGDTKRFYGRQVEGERLDVAAHRGVLSYDPSELVITARAGTPIIEIETLLAEHGQMLAFEPPIFGKASTLGGVIAAGLAGPRRPFAGGVRDFVLGVTVLDGRGDALRLGGTVFKNVAGFDGFRLMAGALGCLGVLLDISLRVVPRPQCEVSVSVVEDWNLANRRLADLYSKQTPLSGAVHDTTYLHLRLSGSGRAVNSIANTFGVRIRNADFWEEFRNMRPFSGLTSGRVWRFSVPRGAEAPGTLIRQWGGSELWQQSDAPSDEMFRAAARVGGHATLFRGAQPGEDVFAPLAPPLLALHKRIKAAFDPAGVFNPGRMYEDL